MCVFFIGTFAGCHGHTHTRYQFASSLPLDIICLSNTSIPNICWGIQLKTIILVVMNFAVAEWRVYGQSESVYSFIMFYFCCATIANIYGNYWQDVFRINLIFTPPSIGCQLFRLSTYPKMFSPIDSHNRIRKTVKTVIPDCKCIFRFRFVSILFEWCDVSTPLCPELFQRH